MTFLKNLIGWLSAGSTDEPFVEASNPGGDSCLINPATNLPMIGGCTSVDVGGSPYGVDIHHSVATDLSSPFGADLHHSIDSNPIGNSFGMDSHHPFGADLFSTDSSMDWSSQSMWDE